MCRACGLRTFRGSQKGTGGLHGKDRSGFTWHRRTRGAARQCNRKVDGKSCGTAGRTGVGTGKAVAVRQTGEEIPSGCSYSEVQTERREKERRGQGVRRKGRV